MGSIGPTIDRIPVLIAQHMPATFTAVLAEHLTRISGRPVREGERRRNRRRRAGSMWRRRALTCGSFAAPTVP